MTTKTTYSLDVAGSITYKGGDWSLTDEGRASFDNMAKKMIKSYLKINMIKFGLLIISIVTLSCSNGKKVKETASNMRI